ncbi:MAG: type II toxin-antitoxin system VapC family toxin [Planctomycetes bacterium]|nr:type II toxin-antitoxin system VapC family toxin [Planctomycetota bacterium]
MGQVVDSSVWIALERRGLSLEDWLAATSDDPVGVAAITASELLAGVARADTPERRRRREAFVERILGAVRVIPFDLMVARVHCLVWWELASGGQMIGAHDLLIAATALAHGHEVLTENRREFDRVSGLTVRLPRWGGLSKGEQEPPR